MKLYYSPGACSLAPHILLHEWNIPHTVEAVDLKTHKTKSGEDFYQVNPKGYVPVLVLDNGQQLTENIAILVYLTDLKRPVKGDKYKFLEWLAFISTELHKSIGGLFAYKDGGPEEAIKSIKDKAAKRLQLVDAHLKDNEFMFGGDFSAVDAYVLTILAWCPMLKVDLTPYANINAYIQRHMGRPAVKNAQNMERQNNS